MQINQSILIAYDGSDDARHAVDGAGALAPGAEAVVVYVREPLEALAAHLEGHPALEEVGAIAAADRDAAERLAAEGAEHARGAGLDARPLIATATGAVGDTIAAVADEIEADLVVVGSRGRRALSSLLLGSVSHHLSHHVRRPLLVIPSPELAKARRRSTDHELVATR